MIIGTYFDGDNDEELKMHQHKYYYGSLGRWVGMAQEKCQQYAGKSAEWDRLIRLWQENIKSTGSFDHRCIQASHDLIAASFRKVVKEKMHHSLPNRKKDAWRGFFNCEADASLDNEEILRLFVTDLVSSGSKGGYDAEDKLCELIQQRHEGMRLQVCKDGGKPANV